MIPRRKKPGEKEDIYLILIKLFTVAFILTATIFTTLIILYPKKFTKEIKKTEIMQQKFRVNEKGELVEIIEVQGTRVEIIEGTIEECNIKINKLAEKYKSVNIKHVLNSRTNHNEVIIFLIIEFLEVDAVEKLPIGKFTLSKIHEAKK